MAKLTRADFPEAFNGGFEPYLVKLRCPRCRSADLSLIEFTEASTAWQVQNGLVNHEGGIHEFGGAVGIRAQCSRCDHGWKPRGAIQVTDLHHDVELEPENGV